MKNFDKIMSRGVLIDCPPPIASFTGSLEREIIMRGKPGIFSHVIKIGPEFLEQKGNVLSVIQPALRSTLGVYDIHPPIVIYM